MADSNDSASTSGDVANAFPRLDPDTEVQPALNRPGHVILFVPGGDRQALVNRHVFDLIQLFDGSRTCTEIADDLIAEGTKLPDRDIVLAVAQQLTGSGLVTFVDERQEPERVVRAVAPLSFACRGCGRSCMTYLVSIGDEEKEGLLAAHEELAADHPHLQEITPFATVHDDKLDVTRTVLRHRDDDSCIYLDEHRHCLIHKHIAADRKPQVCRLYPVVIVETEFEVRVGLHGGCYHLHDTIFTEEPRSLPEATGIPEPELPDPVVRTLSTSAGEELAEEVERLEEGLLWVLSRDDVSLDGVFAFLYLALAGENLPIAPRGVLQRPAVAGAVLARVRSMAAQLEGSKLKPRGGTGPGSVTANVDDFLAAILDKIPDDGGPVALRELTEDEEEYVCRILAEWTFLRHWRSHPSPALSVAIVLMGALAALAVTDAPTEDERVGDEFGFHVATWIRLISSSPRVQMLFGEPGAVEPEIKDFVEKVRTACGEAA